MATTEIESVRKWFENVVLGLELCPFAAEPWHSGRIRMTVTRATSEQSLLDDLHAQLVELNEIEPTVLETTIVIVPDMLEDFDDYNQFLDLADGLVEVNGWTGRFQVASFHPRYRFADTSPDDGSNLTNRSPYPLLHLLREASVSRAITQHGNTEEIPGINIEKLRSLSAERRRELFGFLG